MDGFKISIDADFIHILIDEVFGYPDMTSNFGGYDAQGTVEIRHSAYRVFGSLWFSTGEVWQFYTGLLKAYNDLAGQARFCSSEGNLKFTVTFTARGHCIIDGTFQEHHTDKTQLQFEIEGDQSYLATTLAQLAEFVAKYGDNQGLRQ